LKAWPQRASLSHQCAARGGLKKIISVVEKNSESNRTMRNVFRPRKALSIGDTAGLWSALPVSSSGALRVGSFPTSETNCCIRDIVLLHILRNFLFRNLTLRSSSNFGKSETIISTYDNR